MRVVLCRATYSFHGAPHSRHFSSDAEVIAAVETWLDGQYSELFLCAL